MRVMAIDIGTNSTLHLVADVNDNKLLTVEQGIVRNRLGADIQPDGAIGCELMDFNRDVMRKLAEQARLLGVQKVLATGTHALRQAKNRDDFIDMSASCGVPVRILSGDEEALMAWKGVFGVAIEDITPDDNQEVALLDIGGGSSELSAGTIESPKWSQSIPRGAVTLARDFFSDDPPLDSGIHNATEAAREEYSGWMGKIGENVKLIGIAGTIFSIASLIHDVGTYKAGNVEGKAIAYPDVCHWREWLVRMTLEERRALKSMPPARAESIHAGSIILPVVMEILHVSELTVCERSLLHGLALEMAK